MIVDRTYIDLQEAVHKLTHSLDGQYIGYKDVDNFPRMWSTMDVVKLLRSCKTFTVRGEENIFETDIS